MDNGCSSAGETVRSYLTQDELLPTPAPRPSHRLWSRKIGAAAPKWAPTPRKVRRLLLRYVTRVVALCIFLLLLLLVCVLLTNKSTLKPQDWAGESFPWQTDPRSYLSPMNGTFGPYNVLLDGHSHTVMSDGSLTPGQVVEWGRAHGYNAIVVSDHNTADGGFAAQAYAKARYTDFLVIPGQEYSTCRIHMNILNVNETIAPTTPWPTDDELRAVVGRVHALGGVVVVNHVAWSNRTTAPYQEATLPDHPARETLIGLGVDGIEVVNGNTFDMRSYALQREHAGELFAITGSDMHAPDGAYAWTVLQAANLTVEGVMAELRGRRTSFLLDPGGTRPRNYPGMTRGWKGFAPVAGLSELASTFYTESKGMYSFQGSFCQPQEDEVYGSVIGFAILYIMLFVLIWEILGVFVAWLSGVGQRALFHPAIGQYEDVPLYRRGRCCGPAPFASDVAMYPRGEQV